MHSIRSLFESSFKSENDIPKKYKKRISRKCKHIKGSPDILPKINFPQPGSIDHKKDLDAVKFYYLNPSLDDSFLMSSDRSVEGCFRVFSEEIGIKPDWDIISDLVEDVDTIILNLKFQHKRPRPKYYLEHESVPYAAIKDCKSPAFPSGHTCIAYFIAELLSTAYPEVRQDLEVMADLIGQSRMENGVHYPTDVSSGKMIGQMLAAIHNSEICNEKNYRFERLKKSDSRNFANFLIKRSKNHKECIENLANYLHLSNLKEDYHVPYSECLSSANKIFAGYPVDYVTDSLHLKSIISPLIYSYKLRNIDSPFKIIALHNQMKPECLERGTPGEFRNFEHMSPTGHKYVKKENVYNELLHFCQIKKTNPFLRHAYFEHVHPFSDGNGRIGRVILCKDMNYNFGLVNKMIGNDYIDKLNLYFEVIDQ